MKVSDETLTWGGKAIALVASIFVIKKVANIFKGEDGKFSQKEFGKFIGFWWFLAAASYVVLKEGGRPANTGHIFSETWLFLIFSGLLTVLHLEAVVQMVLKFMEMLWRLKSKTPPPAENPEEEKV